MYGVTSMLVESVTHSLNEKAERLGWRRRYEFEKGNAAKGIQHVLVTLPTGGPVEGARTPIGNTLSKAHQYLVAMGQVLNDAIAEKDRARSAYVGDRRIMKHHATMESAVGVWDPDARSGRPGEGS